MLDFIIENYYVILVICILLIFAIIGYMIDTLRTRKYQETENITDGYVPEEEVFIQKIEEPTENEGITDEENVEALLEEYNQINKENNSI